MSMLFYHKKTSPSPNDRALSFRPEGISYIYSVLISSSAGEDTPATAVQYNMTVKHTGPAPQGSILQFERSEMLVNGTAADNDLMYELGQQCGNAPYPLQLVLNKAGRIIDLFNHDDILERWSKTALYLRRYHESDIALAYIDQTELTLQHKQTLLATLQRDLFLGLYCSAVYHIDHNNIPLQRIEYPALPFRKPVMYRVRQQLDLHGTVTGKCSLQLEGTAELPQEIPYVHPDPEGQMTPEKIIEGKMNAAYEFGETDHHIRAIAGDWALVTTSGSLELSVKVTCIDHNGQSTLATNHQYP